MLGKHAWAEEHEALLQEVHEDICARGWNERVGAFVQVYGGADLDASNLLLAEYGFVDATDPRFVATVDRTIEKLSHSGLLYRYRNADDFGTPRSAFGVCSFWLVRALSSIGRRAEAETRFDELLALANRHGLYGEDFDFTTKRQLGNFPQAYCHLALIDCALTLSDGRRDDEDLICA
jgi:GH15 family glucan-1,4-alpha-glucosidase